MTIKHDHDPTTITTTTIANDDTSRARASCRRGDGKYRAHLLGGAQDGAQQRRHGVRRRPFRAADAAVQKRDGNGTWVFGQRRTIVEDGSSWAVNPLTFKRGYICFGDDNKVLGERLVPVSQPMPDVTELPDKGFEWQQQWAVNLKCIDGTDAGVEVVFKPTTVGGIQAVAGLIEAVRDRLNGGQHDGKVSPIVQLEKDSYQHGQYGSVWTPRADDRRLDAAGRPGAGAGATPASPPPTEQPRRRRVA